MQIKDVINHQTGIHADINGCIRMNIRIILFKISCKLSQPQRRLHKALSSTNSAPRLLIKLLFPTNERRTRNDRCGNAVADILERNGLTLRPFIVCINRFAADLAFHLIPLEADVLNRFQYFDSVDLPVKFLRLHINSRKDSSSRRRCRERIRQAFHFILGRGKTSEISPSLYNDLFQTIHLRF